MSNHQRPKLPVAREILRYFLSHPEATDGLMEIARWRLTQEAVRRTVEDTQDALEWLLAEGYLREERRAGTESLFSLNDGQRKAAEFFVEEGSEGANASK